MIRVSAALIVVLLAGCSVATDGPDAVLSAQGTALYELPYRTDPLPTGIEPGRYKTTVEILYTATQEEATLRCNFGLPGGNDWERKGYIGHEVLHIPFGSYHQ